MLKLTDICKYIKSKTDVGEGITTGIIDEKSKKCIGVYDNNRSEKPRMTLGGAKNIRYSKKKISILVHWGISLQEAQRKADEIKELFSGKSDIHIGSSHIAFSCRPSLSVSASRVKKYTNMLSPWKFILTRRKKRNEQNRSISRL